MGIIITGMPSPFWMTNQASNRAAWAANGSWHNLLMSLFCILNSWMLYRPFFLIHEKMLLQQEQEQPHLGD